MMNLSLDFMFRRVVPGGQGEALLLTRSRTISTRLLRERPPALSFGAMGCSWAYPTAPSRSAGALSAIRRRTTLEARAVDSSQFVGNCDEWIGTLSVCPSTLIG